MQVHLGLAGLPYEVELKFWLACKLLMASSTSVQLHKWDGKPCDILVANLDSEQGQVAYEMAIHGDTRVLFLGTNAPIELPAGLRIDQQATASALAKVLENVLQGMPPANSAAMKGLLGICLLQGGNGHEVLASNGDLSVIIRHHGRRLYAPSRQALEQAARQLLDSTWTCVPLTAPCEHQYGGLVSESLDNFLARACGKHRASLAMISDAAYRLSVWPDLIALPGQPEAFRLACALHRKSWRVADLAAHCGISVAAVNAFCWAMQASGALRLDDAADANRMEPADLPLSLPFVQRVMRQFGARMRQGHA